MSRVQKHRKQQKQFWFMTRTLEESICVLCAEFLSNSPPPQTSSVRCDVAVGHWYRWSNYNIQPQRSVTCWRPTSWRQCNHGNRTLRTQMWFNPLWSNILFWSRLWLWFCLCFRRNPLLCHSGWGWSPPSFCSPLSPSLPLLMCPPPSSLSGWGSSFVWPCSIHWFSFVSFSPHYLFSGFLSLSFLFLCLLLFSFLSTFIPLFSSVLSLVWCIFYFITFCIFTSSFFSLFHLSSFSLHPVFNSISSLLLTHFLACFTCILSPSCFIYPFSHPLSPSLHLKTPLSLFFLPPPSSQGVFLDLSVLMTTSWQTAVSVDLTLFQTSL